MQKITLVCMGGLKERFFADGAAEYQKRLGALCRFHVVELAPERLDEKTAGAAEIAAALDKEGARILKALPQGAYVAALCVEGKAQSSEELAALLGGPKAQGGAGAAFVIGSSHGLAQAVRKRADLQLSLSAMTLPHQMARLVLTEQIYRALMIGAGRSYHK